MKCSGIIYDHDWPDGRPCALGGKTMIDGKWFCGRHAVLNSGADKLQPERPTENVVPIGAISYLDSDSDTILENNKGDLKSVVIMGETHDGEYVFSSSIADGGEVMWMLELCKRRLFDAAESLE